MDSTVRPRLSLLTDEAMDFVHDRSLHILTETGVRVHSRRALDVLRPSEGLHVEEEPEAGAVRVRFETGLVEWALDAAPSVVDVFRRTGEPAFRLGADRTRFGIGVTNLHYQDPRTDELSPFGREHMATATRLGHALPRFDVVSTVGILRDLPDETADLVGTLEMAGNTTKPLVILVSADECFEPALDLLEHLRPGMADAPFALPYLNPVTPLVLNESTGDRLVATVERELPVIYSNFSMAGMSTPVSAAGTLVLLNAELLAGLVVAQLVRTGAPVVLGSLPAYFDMRTLQDFYGPRSMLLNVACAEMMRRYGLPHVGASGSGGGWGPDLRAAGQLWANHLFSLLGRAGLVPFVGGNLSSKAFSPALAVYSDDVIGQALWMAEGFGLSDEEADLKTILERGPGASFLDSELTLASFRDAYYDSELTPRPSLEEWEAQGRPRFENLLRDRTVQLLEDAGPPEDHDEVLARGEAFMGGGGRGPILPP
jgi:trimethylamine--corrinoid protein Co-methyltransferase